jgi:hypothetical protein
MGLTVKRFLTVAADLAVLLAFLAALWSAKMSSISGRVDAVS